LKRRFVTYLLGIWKYFRIEKELGFETEVPIIDTKIEEEDFRRNRFANTGKPEKDGNIFIRCSKINAKKLFRCNDG
jgi:hypothetical protein